MKFKTHLIILLSRIMILTNNIQANLHTLRLSRIVLKPSTIDFNRIEMCIKINFNLITDFILEQVLFFWFHQTNPYFQKWSNCLHLDYILPKPNLIKTILRTAKSLDPCSIEKSILNNWLKTFQKPTLVFREEF